MASKTLIQFPIFAPLNPTPHRPATEVRFSRWNNANAQKFVRQERTQKEIEDELRLVKRFISADNIAKSLDNATDADINSGDTFRSVGTPSAPSRPSIPGKKSKYSKSPRNSATVHPAFRRSPKVVNVPAEATEETEAASLQVSDDGVSYVVPHAPFAFQYSYTETPKVKPLKLREPPVAPFGPSTMSRPWTGRKPLPPGKKKMEFDSFRLPPPHKKGVKPVQAPGPFLPGSGPKYVMSREEILGEPLTKEEIDALVKGCMKSHRQLNMGRDGLTHNMLDNIHALWKRRRVCKIKCKGVCTVDIENVRRQLEEKSGGKVIHHVGGVVYLFRGRNYNYKTRPRFPLMLWRPITPVYPRLVKRVPEGLTLEEANEMRRKGRELIPICKLGKNGVYVNLVKNVREAFEACELARIDCQGMNGSDYRKIGAKLKDLVPCVLISFEREHILMWRGKEWKSSFPELVGNPEENSSETDSSIPIETTLDGEVALAPSVPKSEEFTSLETLSTSSSLVLNKNSETETGFARMEEDDPVPVAEPNKISSLSYSSISNTEYIDESEAPSENITMNEHEDEDEENKPCLALPTCDELVEDNPERQPHLSGKGQGKGKNFACTEKVLDLWKEAVESRTAVLLENDGFSINSDDVYKAVVALAKTAPPGPVFKHRRTRTEVQKTVPVRKVETGKPDDLEAKEVANVIEKGRIERKNFTRKRTKGIRDDYLNVAPKGTLGVDELAKLLA